MRSGSPLRSHTKAAPTIKRIFGCTVLLILSDDEHESNAPVFDDYQSLIVVGNGRGKQQIRQSDEGTGGFRSYLLQICHLSCLTKQ